MRPRGGLLVHVTSPPWSMWPIRAPLLKRGLPLLKEGGYHFFKERGSYHLGYEVLGCPQPLYMKRSGGMNVHCWCSSLPPLSPLRSCSSLAKPCRNYTISPPPRRRAAGVDLIYLSTSPCWIKEEETSSSCTCAHLGGAVRAVQDRIGSRGKYDYANYGYKPFPLVFFKGMKK